VEGVASGEGAAFEGVGAVQLEACAEAPGATMDTGVGGASEAITGGIAATSPATEVITAAMRTGRPASFLIT
jgi:hypothetical protein